MNGNDRSLAALRGRGRWRFASAAADRARAAAGGAEPRQAVWRWAEGAAIGFAAGVLVASFAVPMWASQSPKAVQTDARNALRRLDVARVEALLRAGWSPNTPFDSQGNGALNVLLQTCEQDAGHDRAKLLLVARTLVDNGARIDSRNVWGDTAYSIARAPRYCGEAHPVTRMLYRMCYDGLRPPGDKCLPAYTARSRAGGGAG